MPRAPFAAEFATDSVTSNVYNNWLIGLIVTNLAIVMTGHRVWERPLATASWQSTGCS